MNLPEFTGEASIYESSNIYSTRMGQPGAGGALVGPAATTRPVMESIGSGLCWLWCWVTCDPKYVANCSQYCDDQCNKPSSQPTGPLA